MTQITIYDISLNGIVDNDFICSSDFINLEKHNIVDIDLLSVRDTKY